MIILTNEAEPTAVSLRANGQVFRLSSTDGHGANEMRFTRVTSDPHKMGGVACIRGLHIPVATIIGALAEGMSEAQILSYYPDLASKDIREALLFAAEAVQERELPLVRA